MGSEIGYKHLKIYQLQGADGTGLINKGYGGM